MNDTLSIVGELSNPPSRAVTVTDCGFSEPLPKEFASKVCAIGERATSTFGTHSYS